MKRFQLTTWKERVFSNWSLVSYICKIYWQPRIHGNSGDKWVSKTSPSNPFAIVHEQKSLFSVQWNPGERSVFRTFLQLEPKVVPSPQSHTVILPPISRASRFFKPIFRDSSLYIKRATSRSGQPKCLKFVVLIFAILAPSCFFYFFSIFYLFRFPSI